MIKILFVCHGNICRSPMAEFVLKDMIHRKNLTRQFHIASCATSTEEIGSDIHPGTRRILTEKGIPFTRRQAIQLKKEQYDDYDLILGMDGQNKKNMLRIFGRDPQHKIKSLLDFCPAPRDIADPWYTGNFERTYADIIEGCQCLLDTLEAHGL